MADRDHPATMTVEEAGALLGISRRSAYRAAAAAHIPTIRLGRRILVVTARLRAVGPRLVAELEERSAERVADLRRPGQVAPRPAWRGWAFGSRSENASAASRLVAGAHVVPRPHGAVDFALYVTDRALRPVLRLDHPPPMATASSAATPQGSC
ncbi:MAG: helix-turn-helix domain-containing protein [Actinomycetota bacterium]|nr:helix-turn-helix domain-containing protein [Actinomycetota bacterium]